MAIFECSKEHHKTININFILINETTTGVRCFKVPTPRFTAIGTVGFGQQCAAVVALCIGIP